MLWFANRVVLIRAFISQEQAGQLMGQNSKVVHWPDKPP